MSVDTFEPGHVVRLNHNSKPLGMSASCSCGWHGPFREFGSLSEPIPMHVPSEMMARMDGIEHSIEAVTVVMPEKLRVIFRGLL